MNPALLWVAVGAVLAGGAIMTAAWPAAPLTATPAVARPQVVRLPVHAIDSTGALIPGSVGGVRITVRDHPTGIVLAEGWQEGAPTGAPFTAVFELERPTELEITAEGPLGFPQATRRVSTSLLLAPGDDLPPGGVVLSLHGLIIDVLEPPEPEPAGHDTLPGGRPLRVRARILTLSGEPVGAAPGSGLLQVSARLELGAVLLAEAALQATDQAGVYSGVVPLPRTGRVDVVVRASLAGSDDSGSLRRHLYLAGPAAP
jgi:hypothetical protein